MIHVRSLRAILGARLDAGLAELVTLGRRNPVVVRPWLGGERRGSLEQHKKSPRTRPHSADVTGKRAIHKAIFGPQADEGFERPAAARGFG
jgi:hypothetical protein